MARQGFEKSRLSKIGIGNTTTLIFWANQYNFVNLSVKYLGKHDNYC